jgi:hypothetical protein
MMVPMAGNKDDHPQKKQQHYNDDSECKEQIRAAAQMIAML